MEKFKYLNRDKLNSLPKTAGVYVFKKGAEFLYIGKAINVRGRVKNHFQQPIFKDKMFILPNTDKLGYIKTDSEIEALLLEAELIKKYRPKYNVVWKDDKNYSFVEITEGEFPKISVVHQTKSKSRYIGPFVDGRAIRQTLRILRRTFPFRTCKTLPKKKCLFYGLNLCTAPCENNVVSFRDDRYQMNQKEYKQNIDNIIKILRGKKQQVLGILKKEMKKMSANMEFEKAAHLRNQISYLKNVFQNAHIIKDIPKREVNWPETEKKLKAILGIKKGIERIEGYDVSNIQGLEATGSMVVFKNGHSCKKEYKKFKIKMKQSPNDIGMLKEILTRRFLHDEWEKPQIILIDGGKAQLNAAIEIKKDNAKFRNVKVLSLAKRKNELFIEKRDKPVLLKSLPREISDLILQTRDQAHSFAIAYHKKLRRKKLIG